MVVIDTNMADACALVAAAAVVAAPAIVALATGHRGVIIILMMALMLLTIVRLLVARICDAFFPHVLARLMDFAVLLV